MKKQDPWFLDARAFAFASLVLTKHNEVKVETYLGRDMAIDLLAEVRKDGKPTLRFFGAQMVPYLDLPAIEHADERVGSHLGRDPFEASLPLCVFVVGVRKPEGIYRWVVEPIVEDGHAQLRPDATVNWQTLDEPGASRLIGRVNAWYDALSANPPPKPRGRHARTGS